MTKERWIVTGVAVFVAAAIAWYAASRPAERIRLDLIQQLDAVEKRPADPPPAEWCRPREITLAGESKLAIAVLPNSRLAWRVTVPPKSFLRLWLALEEEAWDKEGDGVLFRVGMSDGTRFRDLLVRQVNPFHMRSDRRWVPVTIDLSAFSGLELSLTFNTNASPPGPGNDIRNDKPLWGVPAIVTMR